MDDKNFVEIESEGNVNKISFSSEVTKDNIMEFKAYFQKLIDETENNFIIDLTTEIKFSPHGLKLILSFYKSLEPLNRKLGLVTDKETKNILDSMSITNFIQTETSAETIIEKMK